MLVTIHQPDFLPWLGFFDRWARSDLYVMLDNVQFLRRGWHHRDRIKTPAGSAWLTVPVQKKGRYEQLISETLMEDGLDWRRRHLATIKAAYGKAPGFLPVFNRLEKVYAGGQQRLMDFNIGLLHLCAELLSITTPTILASELCAEGVASARLVALCQACGADTYLTGLGSQGYLEESLFKKNGIRVEWQQYESPVYPQLHGGFEPMLSVLDYLMMQR